MRRSLAMVRRLTESLFYNAELDTSPVFLFMCVPTQRVSERMRVS